MNYGLYLSASGVLTSMYRQDVFANNLANVNTTGFKVDLPAVRQRDPESTENSFGSDVSKRLLDRLGGGVLAGPQRISFSPSSLQKTGAPLDVAIDSPQAFFAISAQDPGEETPNIRLTRDGRFSRNEDGNLVTLAGGHRVLDVNDQPIVLQDGDNVTIDTAGRIFQADEQIAQIQVTGVSDTSRLVKHGQSLFRFDGKEDLRVPAKITSVRPGYLEASGTDPIKTLMKLISATKSVTGNGNMIRYHDLMMDRAVNVLGRVS